MTDTDDLCPDCGAAIGQPHEDFCDVARCLITGEQRLSCLEPHDDCGEDTWTGQWPGTAECAEYGWWVLPSADCSRFYPCAPGAPGAMPDLNRLVVDCDWDQQACRWVRREPSTTP